jgi:protein gp37
MSKTTKWTDKTWNPEKIADPLKWRDPARVFVCSMSDLFHPDVPNEFIDRVLAMMSVCQRHTFQVLTKRPERALNYLTDTFMSGRVDEERCSIMGAMSDCGRSVDAYIGEEGSGYFENGYLSNVWIGATAENQQQADKRIPLLLQIPAAVRFVSLEPMLGPVDLTKLVRLMYGGKPCWPCSESMLFGLDWVICGGETGPGARPFNVMWARSLRDQCKAAGVPFFYKGAGTAQYSKDDPQYRRLDGKLYEQFPG